jgi:alkanesulfonate monooxygenase SsuD/methylene tetrahydromethanopterin reductase-like flavin-dependent oxidoreductase (luciferase family)
LLELGVSPCGHESGGGEVMRYGLFVSAQHPRGEHPGRYLGEHFEQVRFVRDNGFDSVFAGQHFLSDPFQMLQPMPLLARLAAESGELTIGSGVFLAALLNPIDLAEQVATLDIICGGRFVCGVGLGYRGVENMAFGLSSHRARVLEEKLDAVRRLLEGERVTAVGQGFRLEEAKLSLRPISDPRPPIWLAANSDAAVRRAARVADTWFVNPHATMDELERQVTLFEAERGNPPSELPAIREVCVRRTDEEAIEVARPFLDDKYKAYVSWGQSEALPATDTLRLEWEELREGRFIVGSPETAAEQIRQYRDRLGITHLVFRAQWPGMPHEQVMETLHQLADKVMPIVR